MASIGTVNRLRAVDPRPSQFIRCAVCGQWNDTETLHLPETTATAYRVDPDFTPSDAGPFVAGAGGAFDVGAFDPGAFDVGARTGPGSGSQGIRGFLPFGLGCWFCHTPRVYDGKRGSL